MIPFPYDYFGASQLEGWRQRLILPMDFGRVRQRNQQFARALMASATRLDHQDRVAAYLAALPFIMRWALVAGETAMFLDALDQEHCVSEFPEFQVLSGRDLTPGALKFPEILPAIPRPRRPRARQTVFTASWARWWDLPMTLMAPDICVFNFSPDLREQAAASEWRIRYDNVESLYFEALRFAAGDKRLIWDRDQISHLFALAVDTIGLTPKMRGRLLELLVMRLTPLLERTALELRALRRLTNAPREAWAGTGGYWPSRLVSLEIMRRGGTVRRFHHGYNMIVSAHIEGTVATEFLPSTHFVFPSAPAVERWRSEPLTGLIAGMRIPKLEVLKRVRHKPRFTSKTKLLRSARRRPRVLFASEPLRGYRQWLPSWLPDAVTLDWTLRLGAALKELPIELVNRPHPHGILRGHRHPLNDIEPVAKANFEQLLNDVDVIVLDGSFSRVFCISLMSEKPVVLIDSGYEHIFKKLDGDLHARCCIIRLDYDDRGLPKLDKKELASAVLETMPPAKDLVDRFRDIFGEM